MVGTVRRQQTTEMMKHRLLILTALAGLLLTGCKENNWMDWKAQNDLWLAENAKREGVQTTASGVQYKIIDEPNDSENKPNPGSTVVCYYEGKLINGYQFDGGTASLSMQGIVSGLAEGLCKVRNLGTIEVYVPYYLGYDEKAYSDGKAGNAKGNGTEGTSSYIPPYSVLIFYVELKNVTN